MKRIVELPFSVGDVVSCVEEFNAHDEGQAVRVTRTRHYLIASVRVHSGGKPDYSGFPVGFYTGGGESLGDCAGYVLAWEWPGFQEQRTKAVVGLTTSEPPPYQLSRWEPRE